MASEALILAIGEYDVQFVSKTYISRHINHIQESYQNIIANQET